MSNRAPCSLPARRPLTLALGLAFLPLGVAYAQTAPVATPAAPAAESAPQDSLQLERIVVTGSTVLRSKFKQSVSVSSLDGEQVQKAVAASATELLRAVPGQKVDPQTAASPSGGAK